MHFHIVELCTITLPSIKLASLWLKGMLILKNAK